MNKLLKRIKNDTFVKSKQCESVKYETSISILQLVDARMSRNITQKQMSIRCKVSIATIKRFELLKCDSLLLYNSYKTSLD